MDPDIVKFWHALRSPDINVVKGSVISLPNGVFWGGYYFNGSKLFVRNCYKDLSSLVALDVPSVTQRGTIVTGTPGIGKSFFGYYLLYLAAKDNIPVIYHPTNDFVYLFDGNSVQTSPHARDFLNIVTEKPIVLYLVDEQTPMHSGQQNVRTVLVCSPCHEYYKDFKKRDTAFLYMPVWTIEGWMMHINL